MAVRGKSINLFLMDGTPNGRIKCTLANWTGVAYKIHAQNLISAKEEKTYPRAVYTFYLVHPIKLATMWCTSDKLVCIKMGKAFSAACLNINEVQIKISGLKQLYLLPLIIHLAQRR